VSLVAAAVAIAPRPARADGDPASDVLATQPLFLPQDGQISADRQAQIGELVIAARRAGYPVRVAVIASRSDLGSVTALWRHPKSYAGFLAQELSEVAHGTLLVVMPGGVGVAHIGAGANAGSGVPRGVRVPADRTALGPATIAVVQQLAAAAGHRLATPSGRPPAGARLAAGSHSGTTGPVAWAAFAVGAILIALAWSASWKARPWRRRDGVASSHGS
jgi:hypothetical protein